MRTTGKKGDLLRAEKAKRATYTFSAQQLREHDEAVKREYSKSIVERTKAELERYERDREEEFNKRIEEVWAERERRFKTGHQQGDTMAMASAMMSVTIPVLVENFGWKPIVPGHKTRLQRFCELVIEEMNRIGHDENLDIMRYADEVDKNYGVKFMMDDDVENKG